MRPGTLLRYYAGRDTLLKLIKDGDIVLDMGCYDGFILSKLKKEEKNFVPIALDMDKSGLKIARGNGLTVILASATCIPVKDESVDVVMLLDLIEHVEEDEQLVKESYRVLRKDGTLVLTTPVKNRKLLPLVNMHKIHKQWGHLREGYSREELEDLLTCNHFNILRWSTYFNFLSRYAYVALLFVLRLPRFETSPRSIKPLAQMKGGMLRLLHKWRLSMYSLVARSEVKIKHGGFEHFIICSKQ